MNKTKWLYLCIALLPDFYLAKHTDVDMILTTQTLHIETGNLLGL